ncbi:MAG: J domain-containing protein [Pseudomonadota bacterium]
MDRPGLTKAERQTVHDLICNLAGNLLDETEDEAVKAIYTKYTGTDFDAEEPAVSEDDLKDAMAQMFGVDADAMADAQSPQEMLEQMLNRLSGMDGGESSGAGGAAKPRKKTAKQLAKEAQQQIEADKTSLSIREVYRKLVSALHPDREPDLDERARKTALMQRVNQAYGKKDLLRLLELQLELEHIDASTIAGLSDERLKHYNKVLKEQLAELDLEIEHIRLMLKVGFQMPPYETLTLASVMPRLAGDVAALKRNVRQIKEDIARLDDPKAFKAWIKVYRIELRAMLAEIDASDDFSFFR